MNTEVYRKSLHMNMECKWRRSMDPKVVTGTFSLNDHFVTVLFDSGADFSFVSTKFAPLLNVKHSIVNHGYVKEVADGKKVEVDKIIHDCKLELRIFPVYHKLDTIVDMESFDGLLEWIRLCPDKGC
ncbi:putative reverse transcriptase domain-containing protein [Tanacetum coccineum]|uniref:Reverse transcriptase domain-containing protein n=1 Tax=Tanacetum coccineum TaxID=301880 RepID=A0ABQ5EPN5_9ASTR